MATQEFKQKVMRTLALSGYPITVLASKTPQQFNDMMACIEKKTSGFFKKPFNEAVKECAAKYLR